MKPFPRPLRSYIKDRATLALGHKHLEQFPTYGSDDNEGDSALDTKTREKTERPPLYKVMLLNDDFTPMEFVVFVLERFFGLDSSSAEQIMMTVHQKGLAVVGVFAFEIAETKVTQVMDCAKQNQHPLQCTMEKE
jgi:ATP-dependent Clp protease adaptor protein ClpS